MEIDQEDEPISEDVVEQRALTSTLNSFFVYGKAAHRNLIEPRQRTLAWIPPSHRQLLLNSVNYADHIRQLELAIDKNAEFLKLLAIFGANEFEAPQDKNEWHPVTEIQVSQARSTLKQIYRDWSAEGKPERDICYGRAINELNSKFESFNRSSIRVLVPGAGLGRLAYDIACEGYISQGNEFSYHMLMTSNFILNQTTSQNEFGIYPFLHSFSHLSTFSNQIRKISFPDLCPSTNKISTANNFSFTAGSFTQIYSTMLSSWHVVVTTFFIDTAHNIIEYIETIYNTLVDNGLWVNFGPLLYHFEESSYEGSQEGSLELPLDDLITIVRQMGFEFEKIEQGIKCKYAADERSMGNWEYDSVFWVARKKLKIEREN
ncbi:N2227-like protein-domain-containing protein [Lipomyces japonicus]|uniref:N2227-like protein-domain-containing protein n=1 Tax=Lipomyces japonicus TaxID=56871 RepID=UPI0034D005AD